MMKRKHIPRKFSDTNIIRAILLNVDDHFDSNYLDYQITQERFDQMLDTLVHSGIIQRDINATESNTSSYFIVDIPMFRNWTKNDSTIYRSIEKYVIPLLPIATDVVTKIIMK